MVSIFRLLTVEVKASKLHILVWLKYLYKVNNILLTYKNKKDLIAAWPVCQRINNSLSNNVFLGADASFRWDDDSMPLATVASLRQHPPRSPLCSCHRGFQMLPVRRTETTASLGCSEWFWRMLCYHGCNPRDHCGSRSCLAIWVPKVGTGQLGHQPPSGS